MPDDLSVIEHGDAVGNLARADQIVGDRQRRCAGVFHGVDDEIVDDVRHDRIETGGRFVEEDDLGIGGHGARQPDALLHAAGEFCGTQFTDFRTQTDLGKFFHGNVACLAALHAASLDQAKRNVLPHIQAIEESRPLKQHAEFSQVGFARIAAKSRHRLSIHQNLARVGAQESEHAFDHHRFAAAGAADHHQRLTRLDREVDAVEHHFRAEALLDASQLHLCRALFARHYGVS